MLAQVLANLIDNAQKYARPDVPPRIEVHAEGRDGEVVLTVVDNGIGFDPKYGEEIFKPFVRLQGRSGTSGSGIGLSIVKRVVEKHGGTVEASGRPGEGATFIVRLPTAREDDADLVSSGGSTARDGHSRQEAAHA